MRPNASSVHARLVGGSHGGSNIQVAEALGTIRVPRGATATLPATPSSAPPSYDPHEEVYINVGNFDGVLFFEISELPADLQRGDLALLDFASQGVQTDHDTPKRERYTVLAALGYVEGPHPVPRGSSWITSPSGAKLLISEKG